MVARVVSDARCPGALHAVDARDGLLVRVRVPGGDVATEAFAALADACERDADGMLDITARANVQVRGLSDATVSRFGDRLIAAGLITSRAHERVRNVVASAFAGFDPHERIDVRPVVRAFDASLATHDELAALPAKFVVAIDGGGFAVDVARADLALVAFGRGLEARFALAIGGVVTELSVAPHDGAALLIAAARAALAFARGTVGEHDRMWRLARLADARATIVARLSELTYVAVRAEVSGASFETRDARAAVPRGVLPAHRTSLVNIVPSVPLGRLSAVQVRGIAALATRFGAFVRLGTWRGIALVGVARGNAPSVARELALLGLSLDGSDGFDGVAACAGTAGCGASLADVRADAAAFAAIAANDVASRDVPHTSEGGEAGANRSAFRINVAGCEKRCAMRGGADVDLVARASGYDVLIRGTLVASASTPADAIAIARARRTGAARESQPDIARSADVAVAAGPLPGVARP